MDIRLTSYEPTSLVAVSVAPRDEDMPRDARFVDAAVAAQLEVVIGRLPDDATIDLDALIAEATANVEP